VNLAGRLAIRPQVRIGVKSKAARTPTWVGKAHAHDDGGVEVKGAAWK
jgi:hypothetical protein